LLPDEVAAELIAGNEDDRARLAVQCGWGKRVSASQCPAALLEWGLGAGETSVLAVALENAGATAVIDDAAARAAARTFAVPVIGTLGVLLRARVRGRIPSAAGAIRTVRDLGLYLNENIIRDALKRIGEKW